MSGTSVSAIAREDEVVEAVRDAQADGATIAVRGHGSVLDRVGGPPPGSRLLTTTGLTGVLSHVPEDLIVTVRAGTPLGELREVLAATGQECPIEADPAALDGAEVSGTVGGRLASALAGPRQLNAGRVRDWVLRVRFVTGSGDVVTAGGVTVKDVTGYDLCRLFVGSWGSVGVLTEVTLKVRPIAREALWACSESTDLDPIAQLYRPEAVLRSAERSWIRLEGHPDDVAADVTRLALRVGDAPVLPGDARLSVDPARLAEVAQEVRDTGVQVVTQDGVGVAHLGGDRAGIAAARVIAERAGGAVLVLEPSLGLPPFGAAAGLDALSWRVLEALDPAGVLARGRWQR